MRKYSSAWKLPTVRDCRLKGATWHVFAALVIAADWDGRSHLPYREIAKIAGVSPMSCVRAMEILIDRFYVTVLEQGRGRRPSYLQVAKWEESSDSLVVSSGGTKRKTVVVTMEEVSSL